RNRGNIPWHQRLSTPIIQKVLQYKPLGHWFFSQIAQSRSLRNILKQAYVRPEAITDELVDILLAPARTPGAADVFIAFISYAQGPLADDLLPLVTCPVHILWGENDPWEPIAKARAWTRFDSVKDFVALPKAGHCPMDEAPELVNPYLRQWAALG
ncbi:MAG: alpha/beta fold hydrolase, partial [Synechococcaceae cyanobacterium SM2_3_60]|nr:alpha/beta fold hydrolase [Synechococcaceae cyanobacterium SM2_3_60]